jgi:hypothetical protein
MGRRISGRFFASKYRKTEEESISEEGQGEIMPDPFQKYQKVGLQHEAAQNAGMTKPRTDDVEPTFEQALESLLNYHSMENDSGTPDFILASFLSSMLEAFNATIRSRAHWRGERVDLPVNLETPVPITVYDVHGKSNVIGEAKLKIWPGETIQHGPIYGVIPIFGPPQSNLPIEKEPEAGGSKGMIISGQQISMGLQDELDSVKPEDVVDE